MVIFEELKPSHKYIVRWYFFRKQDIYYLRLNKKSIFSKWVKKYIGIGKIIKIDLGNKLHTFEGVYYDLAFDNIDKFFRIIEESSLLKKAYKLYKNKNINLVFKKVLNEKIARFYYLNFIFNELQRKFTKEKIIFIPSNGIEVYRTDGCEVIDYLFFYKWAKRVKADLFEIKDIIFPFWLRFFSYIRVIKRKFLFLLKYFSFLGWLISKRIGYCKKKDISSHYKYALMIISPYRQFSNRIQKVDFLVDNKLIKKEDCLFISYRKLTNFQKEYLDTERLDYIDNLDSFISLNDIKDMLIYYLQLLFYFQKEFFLEAFVGILYYYLKWEGLIKKVTIEHLITYCDFGIHSICRNIILKKKGCRTYYYMDSINFGCFFSKDVKYRHNNFGFLNYDYFVIWNDFVAKYFESSQCNFNNFVNFGCLWAEHLREIREKKIESKLIITLHKKKYKDKMKLISVFDSTFHDDSITNYKDGIKFLEGIFRLLEDLSEVFIVLKEKKSRGYHKKISSRFNEIISMYEKLENHPRCFCVKGGEEKWVNSSEIIAFSDLTISFPFTSTTFEALSARKRAIWYDANDKFRETFYDAIPGLVCHNYTELLYRVNELLFNISDEDYNRYLELYIKGKLESYLDGKAISRFREFLVHKNLFNSYIAKDFCIAKKEKSFLQSI
ncbi:MAG: polysaccharide biosynthesis PFTS motif protein [Candidatus Omnitrophica bacterium]|nr:polysaccharide biosynthesis PFTS motif protein [Candidatus Omnitrophota bacterium]